MGYVRGVNVLIEKIIAQGLSHRFIKSSRLEELIGGSSGRRYGLVNRALKSGDLVQIQRGLYILSDRHRTTPCHPFALAQALAPGSYVSFETALSFHGLIPERVYTTSSVIPGRKSRLYENEKMGNYSFHPLAIQSGYFLELVDTVQIAGQQVLVATPYRALLDLICLRKIPWRGLSWLSDGLRVDLDDLGHIATEDCRMLGQVYKHKRMKLFIAALCKEFDID